VRLQGKTALITGTGDGIGRGIAQAFAREGAELAICDINERELGITEQLVKDLGAHPFVRAFDVCSAAAIEGFVHDAGERFGKIDILVNNAAVMPVATVEELPEEKIDLVLAVNLKAPILFSKYVTPYMRKAGGGSIIHMSSVTGINGHAGINVYGATKAAVQGLARGQAMELAPYNIRANSISPGTVDSPMLHRFLAENANDPEKARKAFDELHPRGKMATIEEVAAVFVFLASDESANITAVDIRCDGGYCVAGRQPRE
jgi:NAD(P)-dependent dehydrogenase (short-subunit alcohol dehydrogenase family)